jgi:hypothetical protein
VSPASANQANRDHVATIAAAATFLSNISDSPWAPRTLKEIFTETGTDKLWRHGYHRYYDSELLPFRETASMRVLEIGADTGISLGAWLTYFKDPVSVAGVAYKVNATAAKQKACDIMKRMCSKLNIYSLDQSDVAALTQLKQSESEGWNIIIDDGSHKPEHQIISFQNLWEKLLPGGLYVIEDVESSYVDRGAVYGYPLNAGIGVPPPRSAVEKFKQLADVVSRKHFGHPEFSIFEGVDKDVASVRFGDGIIFVQKFGSDPDWAKYPAHTVFGKESSDTSFRAYVENVLGHEENAGRKRD